MIGIWIKSPPAIELPCPCSLWDKLLKKVWQTPHTVPPVSKEIERKYMLPEDAVGFVSQPAQKSMVVKAAMIREKADWEYGTALQNLEL